MAKINITNNRNSTIFQDHQRADDENTPRISKKINSNRAQESANVVEKMPKTEPSVSSMSDNNQYWKTNRAIKEMPTTLPTIN
jgi:hypothetical protein